MCADRGPTFLARLSRRRSAVIVHRLADGTTGPRRPTQGHTLPIRGHASGHRQRELCRPRGTMLCTGTPAPDAQRARVDVQDRADVLEGMRPAEVAAEAARRKLSDLPAGSRPLALRTSLQSASTSTASRRRFSGWFPSGPEAAKHCPGETASGARLTSFAARSRIVSPYFRAAPVRRRALRGRRVPPLGSTTRGAQAKVALRDARVTSTLSTSGLSFREGISLQPGTDLAMRAPQRQDQPCRKP